MNKASIRTESGQSVSFVYFLLDRSTGLAKIGHSSNPASRISALASRHRGIDLKRSAMVETDTRALEYVLHAVFSKSRRRVDGYVDGYTEWFDASIFDEALSFTAHVGSVRGKDYPVTRDLTEVVETHRREAGAKWVGGAMERMPAQRPSAEAFLALLAEVAAERAEDCLEILAEQHIDGLVTDGHNWAIERSVERHIEPELWTQERFSPARWSSRLMTAATVVVSGSEDYGRSFSALTGVTLDRGRDTAQEFIHLPSDWQELAVGDTDLAKRNFFAPLAEVLSELPVRQVAAETGPFAGRSTNRAVEQ